MVKNVVKIVFVLVAMTISANADLGLNEIKLVFNVEDIAADAAYNASTGTLTWDQGALAFINGDLNKVYGSLVTAELTVVDDSASAGGTARAVFSNMNMSVLLYEFGFTSANSFLKLDVNLASGTGLDGYREEEDSTGAPSSLTGQAFINVALSDLVVNDGVDYEWADGNALSGMKVDTFAIKDANGNNLDISDYSTDWFATNNANITISTDESIAIPEPATIGLLSLGGLFYFARKKRRA